MNKGGECEESNDTPCWHTATEAQLYGYAAFGRMKQITIHIYGSPAADSLEPGSLAKEVTDVRHLETHMSV